MLEECPRCHLNVLPMAESLCPNCRKSILDLAGARPELTRLSIRERTRMPACCHQCGTQTARSVRVREVAGPITDTPLLQGIVQLLVALVGGLFAALAVSASTSKASRHEVTIFLPQCEICARGGQPRPIHTDFDEFAMTFLVHVRFKEQILRD